MRVIPYYCGKCGVRISPEDARFGQSTGDTRTHFCPTCVVEYGLAVAGSDQVDLAADAASGARHDTEGAALDWTRTKRVSSRRRTRSVSSKRRPRVLSESGVDVAPRSSSPMLLIVGVGLGVLLAIGGVYLARGDGDSPAASPNGGGGGGTHRSATPAPAPVTAPTAPIESPVASVPDPEPPPPDPAPPEPAPPKPERPKDPPGSFVLNLRTGKLHRKGCRWEAKMSSSNKGRFDSLDEALRLHSELKKCRTCMKEK